MKRTDQRPNARRGPSRVGRGQTPDSAGPTWISKTQAQAIRWSRTRIRARTPVFPAADGMRNLRQSRAVDYTAASVPVGSYRDLAKWMRGDAVKPGIMSGYSRLSAHGRAYRSSPSPATQRKARTDVTGDRSPARGSGNGYTLLCVRRLSRPQIVRTGNAWRMSLQATGSRFRGSARSSPKRLNDCSPWR